MVINWKKVKKISLYILGFLVLITGSLAIYGWYYYKSKYYPTKNQYIHRVAFIDRETSLLSDGFVTCGRIVDYYNTIPGDNNGQTATYSKNKNGLREFILTNYKNKDYRDSGYLNIRFVVNCKGETGRYIIHENDLDLNPKTFNKDLKSQLFQLTKQLKKWNPVIFDRKKMDSYMYISYRIENGEITEIIP